MLKVNRIKLLSSLLCVLLIILCFSLLSCKGDKEADGNGGSDSPYENVDSASAESTEDSEQGSDSSAEEGDSASFGKTELGGNSDSISWDDLTDKSKGQ